MKKRIAFCGLMLMLCATVFAQTVNEQFAVAGSFPSEMTLWTDGYYYVVCPSEGIAGNVSQINPVTGERKIVFPFDGTNGGEPQGKLVIGPDGNLYGVVAKSPTFGDSGIYRLVKNADGTFSITYIREFKGDVNGGLITGGLTLSHDGQSLIAACNRGGKGFGLIVSVEISTGEETILYTFLGGADGAGPTGPPVIASDGTLYGVTASGAIYCITTSEGYKPLYQLGFPLDTILVASDGSFIVSSTNGGYNGSFYRVDPTGTVSLLHQFSDGSFIYGPMVEIAGVIYGIAVNSPAGENLGSFFSCDFGSNFHTLYNFTLGYASGSFMRAADGSFYGGLNIGNIFKITVSGLPPPLNSKLANISTRMEVGTSEDVSIGGFIISGAQAERVVIRAIGPSLSALGVEGAMANPMLELHNNAGDLITTNNDWQDSQKEVIEATGLAPDDPREAALLITLSPGTYTAVVKGEGDTTGVGLVEVYNLDAGNPAVDSKLANISTRGLVQTGSSVMIGGLIVSEGSSANVLLRAIGPSLSSAGIANPLSDPTLELRDSNGVLLASNNDWQDSQKAAIEATGLAPENSKESAIVATLMPGSYTAIVQGANGTMGVGLVEVYGLP